MGLRVNSSSTAATQQTGSAYASLTKNTPSGAVEAMSQQLNHEDHEK